MSSEKSSGLNPSNPLFSCSHLITKNCLFKFTLWCPEGPSFKQTFLKQFLWWNKNQIEYFTRESGLHLIMTGSGSTLTSSRSPDIDLNSIFLFSCDLQSGSQGNLCDSWAGEEDGSGGSGQNSESLFPERRNHGAAAAGKLSTSRIRAMPAEYPFQANLGLPQSSVNFDLTHKRGNEIGNIIIKWHSNILSFLITLQCLHNYFP